jgi:hypothetical protein
MSSHHFVKEQQEPALVILDLQYFSWERLSGLLEWVPTVLVAEEAVDQVLSWGIKIDVIISSERFRNENTQLLEEQYPLRFLVSQLGEHLKEALHYLLASDHKAAHLIGFSRQDSKQLDEFLDKMDLTLFDEGRKYYPIQGGSFKKWFPATTVEIFGPNGLPVQIRNSEMDMILPLEFVTQIELPEGFTEFSAATLIWIGEEV